MAKLFDMCVKVGEYTKDGKPKNRYKTVGAIWEGKDGGQFATLEASFNPAGVERKEGSDSITLSCFPPKQWTPGGGTRQRSEQPREDFTFSGGPEPSDPGVPF